MKAKNAIILAAIILLTAIFGFFTFFNGTVGGYKITSFAKNLGRGVDFGGGMYAVYLLDDSSSQSDAIEIMTSRLNAIGYNDASIAKQGDNRIRIELPSSDRSSRALELISTKAHIEFLEPDGTVIFTGESIVSTAVERYSETGLYGISFSLDDEGTEVFAEATERLTGSTIDITIDGVSLFGDSPPGVSGAITGGVSMIGGGYTYDAASFIAALIRYGELPASLEAEDAGYISAGFGTSAVTALALAAVIGAGFAVLFLIAAYRVSGAAASLALVVYFILSVALSALIGVELNVFSAAGLLLALAAVIRSAIVITGNIHQVLLSGEALSTAILRGYRRATRTIIDQCAIMLIAAIAMGLLGSEWMRDFAIAVAIGAALNLLISAVATRYLLNLMPQLGFTGKHLYGYKLKEAK